MEYLLIKIFIKFSYDIESQFAIFLENDLVREYYNIHYQCGKGGFYCNLTNLPWLIHSKMWKAGSVQKKDTHTYIHIYRNITVLILKQMN